MVALPGSRSLLTITGLALVAVGKRGKFLWSDETDKKIVHALGGKMTTCFPNLWLSIGALWLVVEHVLDDLSLRFAWSAPKWDKYTLAAKTMQLEAWVSKAKVTGFRIKSGMTSRGVCERLLQRCHVHFFALGADVLLENWFGLIKGFADEISGDGSRLCCGCCG